MKKITIILFSIIVVPIVFAGALVFKNISSSENCKSISNTEEKDYCYLLLAKKGNDAVFCSKITIPNTANHCYVQIAQKTGDVSLCSSIQNGDSKNLCLSVVAVAKKDTSFCDLMDKNFKSYLVYKDSCYKLNTSSTNK